MLSIKKTRKLINDEKISNAEAYDIREALYGLADLALNIWQSPHCKRLGYKISE